MDDMEKINLDDYIQTGEGGTALTYNHKDGKTLAKLFLPSMAADNAVREFRTSQVVYESGLPTPGRSAAARDFRILSTRWRR